MKNEKLLAAVLAATMLSAPLTGCGHSRKSLEEIKNENEIRRLLEEDASINIVVDNVFFNHVKVYGTKRYGNYYLVFKTENLNHYDPKYKGDPKGNTFIYYKVDKETFLNFDNYAKDSRYKGVAKETKQDVELIKEVTDKFDPMFADYMENSSFIDSGFYKTYLKNDKMNNIIQELDKDCQLGLSVEGPMLDNIKAHGIKIDCEKKQNKYFVNFTVQEDVYKREFTENLVDYIKISYQVDQSAYDYFKNVDLKDLANIDPVPFEVLTDQYDPVSVEVYENMAEEEMSK